MNKISKNDTIVAVSTPLGEGGIGIVRLSGEDSVGVVDKIFTSPKGGIPSAYASHSIHYGHIRNPGSGDLIDEVLVTVMRAPGTYTAEDVVEINCHGGIMPVKKILGLCLTKGARLAEPGEFTKRAFLNGRIDLSQAEAVLDVIRSESEAARKIAARQLSGVFSEEIKGLRDRITDILSDIELTIDFTEEDVLFASVEKMTNDIAVLQQSVRKVIETADRGMMLRRGVRVVICGRPNVGKSSLMNALLKHDRVIVTPVAGTTRDVIEESINISGVIARLVDTAGIIATQDQVELEGVKRSTRELSEADIVIFMVDASRPLSDEDRRIYGMVRDKKTVVVMNKIDLPRMSSEEEALNDLEAGRVLGISALKRIGLEGIEDAVAEKIFDSDIKIPEGPIVTSERHKEALRSALECIDRGLKVAGKNYSGELLASDLNEALFHLGLITGESAGDDILDRIFSRFCIGK